MPLQNLLAKSRNAPYDNTILRLRALKRGFTMSDKLPYLQNRELSWLRFNDRVLEEAMDATVPLLERLKFVAIFTSNLDEFFMIRVGSLYDLSLVNPENLDSRSAMTPQQQLDAIYRAVRPLYAKRERCFFDITSQLQVHGIHYLRFKDLTPDETKYVKQYFKQSIAPVLSPQIVDTHHPFPHLQNKVPHVVARLKYKGNETFGCVPIPAVLPDVLYLPGNTIRFLTVADIVQEYLEHLFPGYNCVERVQLCLTRNADITTDEESVDYFGDFREKMQKVLGKRRRLAPVRLELSSTISGELEAYLSTKMSLEHHQIYISKAPFRLSFAYDIPGKLPEARRSLLSYPAFTPQIPGFIPAQEKMLRLVQREDVLLSYPYESMNPFLQLLKEAANDPSVVAIKITIYRLASKAKLVDYLCTAAENGKDVTVLIELRARFDEQNNIDWSERLEEAGCTIIYGFEGYKVHSKICLITRREHGAIRYITQIGTGNYNEKTAAMYTDLSLMTADQSIGEDANEFFKNMMIGNLQGEYQHLLVAPVGLKSTLLQLMDGEIAKGPKGRMLFKLNSVTDMDLMAKLREASQAGVQITMIVRGICCILPNIPGETENLHIRSIVGRYLEHSRVYCFGEGPNQKMYIASADFMTRNTERRVEVACPIYDQRIKARIHHILELCLQDNVRARDLQPDGSYSHVSGGNAAIDCQKQQMIDAVRASVPVERKRTLWEKVKDSLHKKK